MKRQGGRRLLCSIPKGGTVSGRDKEVLIIYSPIFLLYAVDPMSRKRRRNRESCSLQVLPLSDPTSRVISALTTHSPRRASFLMEPAGKGQAGDGPGYLTPLGFIAPRRFGIAKDISTEADGMSIQAWDRTQRCVA